MWDFVKLELPSEYATSLLACDALDFEFKTSRKSGEMKTEYSIATYPEGIKHPWLTFIIKGNYVTVSGSLHKFYHKGQNHCHYTYFELIETIELLRSLFGIDPEKAIVRVLEFGANLFECNAQEFVGQSMLHSTKPFSIERFKGRGYLKRFSYSQYEVKVYDKGFHYKLDYNVLRFEKKLRKMESFGFVKLKDLLRLDIIERASNALLETAKALIVSEPHINKSKLTKPQKRLVIDWSNPNYLENLAKSNLRKLKHERTKYKQIVAKNCTTILFNDFIFNLKLYFTEYQKDVPENVSYSAENTKKIVSHIDCLGLIDKSNGFCS